MNKAIDNSNYTSVATSWNHLALRIIKTKNYSLFMQMRNS